MSETEERLVAILDGIGECFYALDRGWRVTVFNRGAETFFGRPRADMLGRHISEVLSVDTVPGLLDHYERAMAGTPSPVILLESPARPGRWLEGRAFPLPDGVGITFRDVTDRRADEEALRRREAELARVQRIAGVGGLEIEFARGFENRRSPEYLRVHGLPPGAAVESHEDWLARIHPDDREVTNRTFRATVKSASTSYDAEYRITRPSDGEVRWISATAEIERDADGRAIRLVGAHRDVTERKRSEAHQRLLIHELNHRVKNTLATVQSIARQSLRGAATPEQAWGAFEGRLLALSRVHDVLTRENWESADLLDVVSQALDPYRGAAGQERIVIRGPSVRLAPRTALGFAMAFQELATNALKYGALSSGSGSVEVTWTRQGVGLLDLVWRESGGPKVARPKRKGFGTRLLQTGLADDLGGAVELRFEPSGLVVAFTARADPAPDAAALTYQV